MPYPTELIQTSKHRVERLRDSQKSQFEAGKDVGLLLEEASDTIDSVLIDLWQHYLLPFQDFKQPSLIATGGYGRSELHPGSDIDLMILLPKKYDKKIESPLSEFLTVLWDIGLEIGHSVRTLKETISACKSDITIATCLQEARLIIGDTQEYEAMIVATGPKKLWPSEKFFQAKFEEQEQRHHRYRRTAYNLEPNVKANIGGLRDMQVIAWVLKRHFDADLLHELVELEFLTQQEYDELSTAKAFLWKIRFALHLLNGGREDRLLFDAQLKIAELLGYQGSDSRRPVELFMRDYYRAALTLSRLNWMLLQMFRERILEKKKPSIYQIDTQLQSRNNYLDLITEQEFEKDPSLILKMFSVWQKQENLRGITARTNRKLHEALDKIDDDFRNNPKHKALFLDIFNNPYRIYNTLARMNRHGVLGRFMPTFGDIVGHMQFDLFHAYTVDAHILFVIKEIQNLLTLEHDEVFLNDAVKSLDKPNMLLLSGLFHDIAKGRDGDHSNLGTKDVEDFGQAYGLSTDDIELLSFLVKNHLLLSVTAQKKDIDDPAIIAEFAKTVKNKRNLNYLYLLTIADVKGTNPELWNQWKAVLFAKLFQYTLANFDSQIPDAEEHIVRKKSSTLNRLSKEYPTENIENLWATIDDEYFLRHSYGEIRWHTRVLLDNQEFPLVSIRRQSTHRLNQYDNLKALDIFVAAAYDQHLFTKVCVALDNLNLDIYNAKLYHNKKIIRGHNSVALTFRVREAKNDIVINDDRIQKINNTISEVLHSEELYNLPNTRLTRQMRVFDAPTKISYSEDPSNSYTILELETLDRPGLLALVSYCFSELNIDINLAKITTIGERAEDVFYLSNIEQQKLSTEQEQELAAKIHFILDQKNQSKVDALAF